MAARARGSSEVHALFGGPADPVDVAVLQVDRAHRAVGAHAASAVTRYDVGLTVEVRLVAVEPGALSQRANGTAQGDLTPPGVAVGRLLAGLEPLGERGAADRSEEHTSE